MDEPSVYLRRTSTNRSNKPHNIHRLYGVILFFSFSKEIFSSSDVTEASSIYANFFTIVFFKQTVTSTSSHTPVLKLPVGPHRALIGLNHCGSDYFRAARIYTVVTTAAVLHKGCHLRLEHGLSVHRVNLFLFCPLV